MFTNKATNKIYQYQFITKDLTGTMKCRTPRKAMFLHFNLYPSQKVFLLIVNSNSDITEILFKVPLNTITKPQKMSTEIRSDFLQCCIMAIGIGKNLIFFLPV